MSLTPPHIFMSHSAMSLMRDSVRHVSWRHVARTSFFLGWVTLRYEIQHLHVSHDSRARDMTHSPHSAMCPMRDSVRHASWRHVSYVSPYFLRVSHDSHEGVVSH